MKMARAETVSERMSHCTGCEHNKMHICAKCGCIVPAKARLAGSFCPIGLWGREEDEPKVQEIPVQTRDLGIRSLFRR